jgi:hypothetical protein
VRGWDAEKPSNKGKPAEIVEGRSVAKGNVSENPAARTPRRDKPASMGLEGVRIAAKRDKKLQFTALLHHITPQLLEQSFYALRKDAAPGVDGVTWQDYEEGLHTRVQTLHPANPRRWLPGHTITAGTHPQSRWQTARTGHSLTGGQNCATGGRDRLEHDL